MHVGFGKGRFRAILVVYFHHYTPNIELAFNSVEYIMRDVPNGWLIRYIHANGASMFFIVVYAHIGRGLYYGSYMEPRELLWCSGVILLLLMMGTAFTGARVRRVGRFSTQETSAGITRLIQSLKASCGDVWSCFNFKNISSLVLHEPRVARAKRFNRVLKAFINYLKALKGVVSRLFRAFFLRISSLIPKRFWIYSKAHNYIKPVLTKNRTTLTNTLNYNVRGEIRKIMLPNRGTRSDNRLAPRHRYFSTVIPQTGALVPVKNKSEHFNQTSSLLFNKTSQVSLDTILFIEKMTHLGCTYRKKQHISSHTYRRKLHIFNYLLKKMTHLHLYNIYSRGYFWSCTVNVI